LSETAFFYHASQKYHEIGEVWEPRKKVDWMGPAIGSIIERFRDTDYTPRSRAIYMNKTLDFSCHVVKHYKYKYLVKPIGRATPHDNTWLGALQGWRTIAKYKKRNQLTLSEMKTIEIIEHRYKGYPKDEELLVINYWKGLPSDNQCWEWITNSIEILEDVSNC